MVVSIPERLSYVRIITTKDLSEKVVTELHNLGAIHVEKIGKLSRGDIERIKSEYKLIDELSNVIKELEGFIEKSELVVIKETIPTYDIHNKVVSLLKKLKSKLNSLRSLKRDLDNTMRNIDELKLIKRVVEQLMIAGHIRRNDKSDIICYEGKIFSSITFVGRRTAINEFLGVIKSKYVEDIIYFKESNLGHDEGILLLIVSTKSLRQIEDLSNKLGLRRIKLRKSYRGLALNELLSKIDEDIKLMNTNLSNLKKEINEEVDRVKDDLALSKALMDILRDRFSVLMGALSSRYLIGIEGWVPVRELPTLMNILHNKIRYVLLAKVSTKKSPPTKLRNPKVIRLFEVITKIYGIPGYDEWDPTPIISVSLMIFFGLMFGDVIYGIIMFILINFVLERTGLIDNPYSPGYLAFKKLLTCLSISSIVFGFLSNNYAGYSIVLSNGTLQLTIVKHPTINTLSLLPINNPIFFIKLALIIGLIHVNIAHALALAKALKSRNKGEILSKVGFFIAEIFGIPYVLYEFLNMNLGPLMPYANYLVYGAIAGVGILIAGKFVEFRALGAMFWLFDLTGLLGDVMSYTRLAGIGLATTLLAQNFNSLALGAIQGIENMIQLHLLGFLLGVIIALVIMVLANLLNIVFGIIGAFIHSLRLCFVEFLPKFYEGTGREFKPFALTIPKAVIVGKGT